MFIHCIICIYLSFFFFTSIHYSDATLALLSKNLIFFFPTFDSIAEGFLKPFSQDVGKKRSSLIC